MRIVFLGSGEFGVPTLNALCEAHDVRLVVSQPDKPAGRKRHMTPTPISQWAADHDLPIIKPKNINEPDVVQRIRDAEPEANIVVAFGQKIGPEVISSPSYGERATMNLHASLLPKYRGAAPINWAIIRGEKETGNTVFSLVERMDAGDMLGQQRTRIDPMQTAGELHDRLSEMGPSLVLDVLSKLEAGTMQSQPQNEAEKTIAPKLGKSDGVMDFRTTSEFARCRVHGLTPWPGVSCWWAKDPSTPRSQLYLRRVEAIPSASVATPGTMIADGVVATGSGAIRLQEVQPPGKRLMNWANFQNGHQLPIGAHFYSEATDED
ncbi:methionyl-tRNA formyltransferase [Planctomycetales bacterium ZRK34]|nr:methionyl-tRNA formyltransferase [Planctomycetales bacterium ZRK34]